MIKRVSLTGIFRQREALLAVMVIALAMIAGTARVFDNPLILEWHNAGGFFADPIQTVVGMVLLLLALRWPPVQDAVAPAAGFLLQHLSLLFVPVGVGVMTHLALLSTYGLQLVAVIVLSTWIGMAVTAQVLGLLQPKEDHGELR